MSLGWYIDIIIIIREESTNRMAIQNRGPLKIIGIGPMKIIPATLCLISSGLALRLRIVNMTPILVIEMPVAK
jgi:hypothetical protein